MTVTRIETKERVWTAAGKQPDIGDDTAGQSPDTVSGHPAGFSDTVEKELCEGVKHLAERGSDALCV